MRPTVPKPLFFCIMLAAPTSWAYDVHTHTAMTSEAVAQSAFGRNPNTSPLLARLGLVDGNNPFNDRYIDMSTQLNQRYERAIERKVIKRVRDESGLTVRGDFSIAGWFMRGAVREDDNSVETPNADEPGGVFDRVYGHFFDPVNDRGIRTIYGTRGPTSADWALLPAARVPRGLPADRENHFQTSNAREAMWRALTLKSLPPSGVMEDLQPYGGNTTADKENERKAYWATTFRALGDVVHLLQDAGQPRQGNLRVRHHLS